MSGLRFALFRLSFEGPSHSPKTGETGFGIFNNLLRDVAVSIRAPWRALFRQRRGIHPASKPSRQIQRFRVSEFPFVPHAC
jgi:hypothetical protein